MDTERRKLQKRNDKRITIHLLAAKDLREVNLALLDGLRLASHVMKNWDRFQEDRRQSIVGSIDQLIAQTEMIYQTGQHQQ